MPTDPTAPTAQGDLYARIAASIEACTALPVGAGLDAPLLHVPSTTQHEADWQPKSLMPGAFAETPGSDPVVEVVSVRLTSATSLYVKLRLKQSDHGPVRCVVVLNGSHSIRFSIGRGKVERRRTYAAAIFTIQRSLSAGARGLDVEILKGATLLHYARLTPRPQGLRQWFAFYGATGWRLVTAPVLSTLRMRAFRVDATRLLEESFRIRTD